MIIRNFPIPANWQDFQILIKDIFNEKYGGFTIYGSNGQAQNGVDVFGKRGKNLIGIQCKRLGGKLPLSMIKSEVKKAETFTPSLTKFIIATTDRRDAKIQKSILELNTEREKDGLFEIYVLYWDDIEDEINGNANILVKYYDDVMLNLDSNYKNIHILEALRMAYNRPAFSTEFRYEHNIKDFIKAIEDTHEYMNTGKLRNRNGEYIMGSFPYKKLPNAADIKDGDQICDILQQIRNCIANGKNIGAIEHCRDDCYCVKNNHIEYLLDEYRREIFEVLNRIFVRNNQVKFKTPY